MASSQNIIQNDKDIFEAFSPLQLEYLEYLGCFDKYKYLKERINESQKEIEDVD